MSVASMTIYFALLYMLVISFVFLAFSWQERWGEENVEPKRKIKLDFFKKETL